MGQGIYSNCYNDYGSSFNGTDVKDKCMYDQGNLASLPTGSSSFYVETKNSGNCFFKPSYLVEGFALPGQPPGYYSILLGICSNSAHLTANSPWIVQEVDSNNFKFYMWTLPGEIAATIQGITICGTGSQLCIGWLIPSPSDKATGDKAPLGAPFELIEESIPEDGSDRQGEPGR